MPAINAMLMLARSMVRTLRRVLATCENKMMYREFCAASLVCMLKIIQHHQIAGAAADAEEARHDAEEQADHRAGKRVRDLLGGDLLLVDGVDERPDGDDHEHCRLDGTGGIGRVEQALNHAEQVLAHKTAHGGAHGERRGGLEIDLRRARGTGAEDGIGRHGQHRAPRQEVMVATGKRPERIEDGLDDHAAADAADGTDDRREEADGEEHRDIHDRQQGLHSTYTNISHTFDQLSR